MTLVDLLVRPVAYHPVLARLLGSVPAAVMLSQAIYWQQRVPESRPPGCPGKGWWYHTAEEWEKETALSEGMQLTARKTLRQTSFWSEKAAGMPRRLWFRVDFDELEKVLKNQQCPGIRGTGLRQSREQDGRFTGDMLPVIPRPLQTETTPEITPETTTGPDHKKVPDQGGDNSLVEQMPDQPQPVGAVALIEEYIHLVIKRDRPSNAGGYGQGVRRRIHSNGGLSPADLEELNDLRAQELQVTKIKKKRDAQLEQELKEMEIVARHKEIWQDYLTWPESDRRELLAEIRPKVQQKLKGIVSLDKLDDENYAPIRAEIVLQLMGADQALS